MKRVLGWVWGLTLPLRLKAQGRLDAIVYEASLRALEAYNPARPLVDELTLMLDALMAEQFRLQSQIDELQARLREAADAPSHASTFNP